MTDLVEISKVEQKVLKNHVTLHCISHKEEKKKYFCISCHKMICAVCIIQDHKNHETKPYEHNEHFWKKLKEKKINAIKQQIELLDKMDSVLDFTRLQLDKETTKVLQEEKKRFYEKVEEYQKNLQNPNLKRTLTKKSNTFRASKPLPKTPKESILSPKESILLSPVETEKIEIKEEENPDFKIPFDKNLTIINIQKRLKDQESTIENIKTYYNENINIKVKNYNLLFQKYYNQALFLKADKKFQEAVDCLDKILSIQKNDLATLSLKAQLLDKLKKLDEYKIIVSQILESPILDLNDMFGYGETLFRTNQAEGFMWIQEAASKGNPYAQNRLAFIYFSGEYVKKDKNLALQWFQKSADQGNAVSQYNYGYSVMNGEGTPKNITEGLKYIILSAKQGYTNAEFRLGKYYAQNKDYQEARTWYERGITKGHEDSMTALEILPLDDNTNNNVKINTIDQYGKNSFF